MKRVLLAAVAVGCLSSQAFAWDGSVNNPTGPVSFAEQGNPQSQAQHQGQHQGQRQTINFSPTINTSSNGGTGGSGGASSTSAGSGPAGVSLSSGYGSLNGSINARQAPDVYLPSLGGGGSDCPVVGFGVGGSGPGAGGGFGPTWISGDCNTRKLADMLIRLKQPDAALALLENHFPEVRDAVRANQASVPNAQPIAAHEIPKWCAKAMLNRNPTVGAKAYIEQQCGVHLG